MTRILALSDTHLEGEELPGAVVRLAREADMIMHAGDFVSGEVYLALAELGRLEAVRGNSDLPALKKQLPERKVVDVEGISIGLVHTAFHGSDLLGAQMMAREMDAKVLVFGHIHRPVVEKGERLLICPGSPTQPRMSAPSAAMLEISDGNIQGRIVPLGSPVCDYLKFAGELAKKV